MYSFIVFNELHGQTQQLYMSCTYKCFESYMKHIHTQTCQHIHGFDNEGKLANSAQQNFNREIKIDLPSLLFLCGSLFLAPSTVGLLHCKKRGRQEDTTTNLRGEAGNSPFSTWCHLLLSDLFSPITHCLRYFACNSSRHYYTPGTISP